MKIIRNISIVDSNNNTSKFCSEHNSQISYDNNEIKIEYDDITIVEAENISQELISPTQITIKDRSIKILSSGELKKEIFISLDSNGKFLLKHGDLIHELKLETEDIIIYNDKKEFKGFIAKYRVYTDENNPDYHTLEISLKNV